MTKFSKSVIGTYAMPGTLFLGIALKSVQPWTSSWYRTLSSYLILSPDEHTAISWENTLVSFEPLGIFFVAKVKSPSSHTANHPPADFLCLYFASQRGKSFLQRLNSLLLPVTARYIGRAVFCASMCGRHRIMSQVDMWGWSSKPLLFITSFKKTK